MCKPGEPCPGTENFQVDEAASGEFANLLIDETIKVFRKLRKEPEELQHRLIRGMQATFANRDKDPLMAIQSDVILYAMAHALFDETKVEGIIREIMPKIIQISIEEVTPLDEAQKILALAGRELRS